MKRGGRGGETGGPILSACLGAALKDFLMKQEHSAQLY